MRRILVIAALLIGLIVTAEASRRRLLNPGSGGSGGGSYVLKDSAADNDFDSVIDTAGREMVGGSWTAGSSYSLGKVTLELYRVGTPTNHIFVEIRTDNGSIIPSGTVTATSTNSFLASDLTTSSAGQAVEFLFDAGVSITSGVTNHIVINPSGTATDVANYVGVRIKYNTQTGHRYTSFNGAVWSQRYGDSTLGFEVYSRE